MADALSSCAVPCFIEAPEEPVVEEKLPLTPSPSLTETSSIPGGKPFSFQLKAVEETWVSFQVNGQSEKKLGREGKIRVFRVWDEDLDWDSLPIWVRILTPRRGMYILIPSEDVERIKKERIEKAEEKIKKLKG